MKTQTEIPKSDDQISLDCLCGPAPVVRPPWCRIRVQSYNTEPSRTQQGHFDQTDVNAIVARFDRDGYLPPATRNPQYADVTGLQGDLTERLREAQETIKTFNEFEENWKPEEPVPPPQPVPPEPPTPA